MYVGAGGRDDCLDGVGGRYLLGVRCRGVRWVDGRDRRLCYTSGLFVCRLIDGASWSWFGAVALPAGSHLCGVDRRLRRPPAQRIAKAEEDRAEQSEREEDAKDRGGSQRDLAILFGGFVKILQIMVGFVSSVHGQTFFSRAASGVNVLLNRFMSSMGRGNTMVVFFSTP